jgi:hypothetical protein
MSGRSTPKRHLEDNTPSEGHGFVIAKRNKLETHSANLCVLPPLSNIRDHPTPATEHSYNPLDEDICFGMVINASALPELLGFLTSYLAERHSNPLPPCTAQAIYQL